MGGACRRAVGSAQALLASHPRASSAIDADYFRTWKAPNNRRSKLNDVTEQRSQVYVWLITDYYCITWIICKLCFFEELSINCFKVTTPVKIKCMFSLDTSMQDKFLKNICCYLWQFLSAWWYICYNWCCRLENIKNIHSTTLFTTIICLLPNCPTYWTFVNLVAEKPLQNKDAEST